MNKNLKDRLKNLPLAKVPRFFAASPNYFIDLICYEKNLHKPFAWRRLEDRYENDSFRQILTYWKVQQPRGLSKNYFYQPSYMEYQNLTYIQRWTLNGQQLWWKWLSCFIFKSAGCIHILYMIFIYICISVLTIVPYK